MKGLELIKRAFALQEVERIPWVPFVGVHGGKLIEVDAESYLKSADHVVAGVSKAIEEYQPDGVPVVFDLQVEAEILGCQLQWAPNNPPAVISHPLAEGKTLADLKVPEITDGRIPVVVEATRRLREKYPDIALYGLITGPFTLALHLMGTDIFMKLFESPDEVNRVMDFCRQVGEKMSEYLIDAGADVIAVVDPMTSQIDPMTFEMFVTPYVSSIFEYVRKREKLSSFFVCGHAQQNIEAMCNCKPDNVSIDENIPLDYVKEIALGKGISFGGNMKLTVVLLMGDEDDSREDAMNCMELGGKKGFILAPGCDLPMDTPIENLKAVADLVHDPYKQEVVRALEKKESKLELLNLSDYGQGDKVIVDVITLDSTSCAPCQYMVEAVKQVMPEFEGLMEWREHAIKKMDAVQFMASLGVKNIPTICIDGEVAFVSQIPPKQELAAAIQKRINEKMRQKIRQNKNKIVVVGESEQECMSLVNTLEKARTETAKNVEIEVLTGSEAMNQFGVEKTPAIFAVQQKLKAQTAEISLQVAKEWLKEL